jgi:DNA-binding MurR/RpiR family transcriptional regulator
MAPGRQRIATIILNDPEGSAFRTIGETAQASGVHESSVVRFATSLGLPGYPALVELCRQQLTAQVQLIRRFDRARAQPSTEGFLAAISSYDRQNLTRTLAAVDGDSWDEAVQLLADASAVHTLGLRKCFAVAYLLSYLLRLVRHDVHQLSPPAGLFVDELRELRTGDVFVAVSIHRYTADTVDAFAYAKEHGLRTIALTDSPASPLVPNADIVFYVETTGVTILRSLTAFTSLVQALATAVAIRLGARSRSELLVDEQLLDRFGVYVAGPDGRDRQSEGASPIGQEPLTDAVGDTRPTRGTAGPDKVGEKHTTRGRR